MKLYFITGEMITTLKVVVQQKSKRNCAKHEAYIFIPNGLGHIFLKTQQKFEKFMVYFLVPETGPSATSGYKPTAKQTSRLEKQRNFKYR